MRVSVHLVIHVGSLKSNQAQSLGCDFLSNFFCRIFSANWQQSLFWAKTFWQCELVVAPMYSQNVARFIAFICYVSTEAQLSSTYNRSIVGCHLVFWLQQIDHVMCHGLIRVHAQSKKRPNFQADRPSGEDRDAEIRSI
jgi:hypothetical protein